MKGLLYLKKWMYFDLLLLCLFLVFKITPEKIKVPKYITAVFLGSNTNLPI